MLKGDTECEISTILTFGTGGMPRTIGEDGSLAEPEAPGDGETWYEETREL